MNNPPTLPGGDTVKNITELLAAELSGVQTILEQTLETESRLIREVGEYVSLTRGKKLRPMLALLTARALGPAGPGATPLRPPIEVAAALELIHVATLLHDDVIDKAETRRGRESVNARWGDDVAILMADYLYARAFDLALSTLNPGLMRTMTQVTQRMCEGEMFQIELRSRNLSETDYYRIVERKTGQLFSACTGLGAMLAGRPAAEIEAARAFGSDFGVAFQITDDALDFAASDDRWGKDIGMDVSGGKQTLPLVLALQAASEADREFLARCWSNGRDFEKINATVRRYRGLELATDKAREYADLAAGRLSAVEPTDSEAFDQLVALPSFVINRLY